jgi:hypothetical protein
LRGTIVYSLKNRVLIKSMAALSESMPRNPTVRGGIGFFTSFFKKNGYFQLSQQAEKNAFRG